MAEPYYDKKDQFERVSEILVPGEQLLMVLDCKGRGSGFLGITDKRLVIRDDGFAKFKKNMVSVPYSKIHAVGLESDRGWVRGSSSLAFSAGDDDWELDFKGADKARNAYFAIMTRVL